MADAPIVRVEHGELQGRLADAPSGRTYYSFQGIPYAKPPLGSLRFKAPQPAEPWEGIRDATSEGNISAQIDPFTQQYAGDENCLFLNVYTPNLDGEFLPVMLFIHGGGFKFGSGTSSFYGPDYLIDRDVVIVTINYRCGPIGFLSLNTPEVPGNAGLKDIVQAVRWVKENIHNFGGNSGNLTVFGESCGGVAVSILTASPLTKNLINKGIIQSGTGLNSWGFQKNPIENARQLAKLVGCESEDVDDILEFLTATSVKDIVEAHQKMSDLDLFFLKGANTFAPVIEKEFPGVEAVLTEAFIDILTSGRVAEIPIMIGTTTLEFTYEKRVDDLQVFIPEELNIPENSPEAVEIASNLKALYYKGKGPDDSQLEYFQLLSDRLVNVDTHRYVQYLVQTSNKPIYYYKFDYVGELNLSKKLKANLGFDYAAHMDELGYLFKNDFQEDVEPTPQDEKMRERMLRLWTNFAKCGNPTPDETHYLTVTWLPVSKDNLYYLNLGNELSLETDPDKEKMEFWESLYNKYFKIWDHPKVNDEDIPRKEPELIEVQEVETVDSVEEIIADPVIEENNDDKVIEENNDEKVIEEINEEPIEQINRGPVVEQVDPVKVQDVAINDTNNGFEQPKVIDVKVNSNGIEKKVVPRTSNEIKMVQTANGTPKDVIRANDPPEDDLPKNIGVNKFVNFFESLGGKK